MTEALNGVKQKPKLTEKQKQRKELNELKEQVSILRKQFQQFNFRLIQDLQLFEGRTMTSWEYIWSLIEALREEGNLEFLTEENLEKFRKVTVARWRAEALDNLKEKLDPGQAVCMKCHTVAGGPNFFEESPDESVCPNCKEKGTAFLKDTEIEG